MPAQQFDARGDGIEAVARQRQARMQHAVDAVADAELPFLGLDVNIRRAFVERLRQRVADEFHHRRFLGQLAQAAYFFGDAVPVAVERLLDDVQGAVEILVERQPPLDGGVPAEGELDHLVEARQQGIARDAMDGSVALVLPHERLLIEPPFGRLVRALDRRQHERGIGGDVARRQDRQTELLGQRAQEIAFGDGADAHQHRAEASAELGLEFQAAFEIGGVDEAAVQEKLPDRKPLGLLSRCGHIGDAKIGVVHDHVHADVANTTRGGAGHLLRMKIMPLIARRRDATPGDAY